jgi:phosphoadenosine phosphosulfate reductase
MVMLIENVIWGIRNKVDDSIDFLKEHEPKEGYYVAFSGGKDSIVTLDLVRRSGCKHDAHMNLTSVDPPELLKFVREHYPDIDYIKPRKSMHNLIVLKGFPPTRQIRYCCGYLKEQAGKGRFIVTGVRREESSTRSSYPHIEKSRLLKNTVFYRPILTWTESDIWDYIEEQKLVYPSLYDEGFSRLGCVMCPLSGKQQMLKEAKRWPHIYKMYLGAMDKAIIRNKERGKKCNQATGQEMMDWWINGS